MTSIASSMPIVITPNDLTNSMTQGLTSDAANMATLEEQVSSGNAINYASDNPSGASTILQLQGAVTRANQYSTNATDGVGWLDLGNSTASSVITALQSLQSTIEGVSGANLTSEPSTITSTSAQVSSALAQLINLANTTEEGGQPIFAGTGSATQAYAVTTNPTTGAKYATYVGNSTVPTRTVAPGTQIAVAVTGQELFGPTTSAGGSTTPDLLGQNGLLNDIITNLNTASSDLSSGNKAGATAALAQVTGQNLTDIGTALSQAEDAAGALGANQQEVQNFSTQATNSLTSIQTELGSVQDTNMAQALTNLQAQQTAYQSALYATSQLHSDSLVQYL